VRRGALPDANVLPEDRIVHGEGEYNCRRPTVVDVICDDDLMYGGGLEMSDDEGQDGLCDELFRGSYPGGGGQDSSWERTEALMNAVLESAKRAGLSLQLPNPC
jgi:hypothetical protein